MALTRFVLTWWFVFSALHSVQVVGPFESKKVCQAVQRGVLASTIQGRQMSGIMGDCFEVRP